MERFANNAASTLSAAVAAGATSLTVAGATAFPSAGNFRILIDSEIMLVTAVAGTTFTVTRGQEGTTGASHASGAAVTHIVTAGSLAAFRADSLAVGTYSARPASGVAGRLYVPTDGIALHVDDGTVWRSFGPVRRLVPPDDTAFTWINQGAAAVTQSGSALYLREPGVTSRQGRLRLMPTPTPPYTLTAAVIPTFAPSATFQECGLVLYNTGGIGPLVYFGMMARDTASNVQLIGEKQTSPSNFSASYFEAYVPYLGHPVWLRIKDDGTNRTLHYSMDGLNFEQIHSAGRTDWITPDRIGYFVDCNSTNVAVGMTLLSWEITQP